MGCTLTSVCFAFFLGNFYHRCCHFLKHHLYFVFSSNMEKAINCSGDEEGISCELPNFNLQFFDEPPAKTTRFANLSEKEMSELLEQRHSEKTKKCTNWSVTTFRGELYIVTVLESIFSNLATIKSVQAFIVNALCHRNPFKCFRRANLSRNINVLTNLSLTDLTNFIFLFKKHLS